MRMGRAMLPTRISEPSPVSEVKSSASTAEISPQSTMGRSPASSEIFLMVVSAMPVISTSLPKIAPKNMVTMVEARRAGPSWKISCWIPFTTSPSAPVVLKKGIPLTTAIRMAMIGSANRVGTFFVTISTVIATRMIKINQAVIIFPPQKNNRCCVSVR